MSEDTNNNTVDPTQAIILRLVAKMTEIDEEVSKFSSTRIGVLSDLNDIESRVSTLEEQSIIIKNKLDQHQFPTLMEEFMAYKKSVRQLSAKTSKTMKKAVRSKKT